MAAGGNNKKKSKVWFMRSNGTYDTKQGLVGIKVSSNWNPGKAGAKRRKRKGHNNFKTWQTS